MGSADIWVNNWHGVIELVIMRMCAGEQVEAWQRLSAELDKIEGKQDQEKIEAPP